MRKSTQTNANTKPQAISLTNELRITFLACSIALVLPRIGMEPAAAAKTSNSSQNSSPQPMKQQQQQPEEDCTGCRVIGSLTCASISVYTLHLRAMAPKNQVVNRVFLACFSVGEWWRVYHKGIMCLLTTTTTTTIRSRTRS